MNKRKIKPDEVCAWCGIHMMGIGQTVADDHICLRCFRDYAVEKKRKGALNHDRLVTLKSI